MADAEHRRLGKPLAHQPIEARLRRLVHRRSRLVEKEPLGLLDQGPREGDALLLAGGKPKRPVGGVVEAHGELGESHDLERFAQGPVLHTASRHRITHHVAEHADRQVRPLRQKQDPGVSRRADLATSKRPDAGDGTDDRALARARRAAQEDGVAAPEREIDVRQEDLTVGPIEVDTRDGQLRGTPLDAPKAARRLPVHPLERALEAGEPFDHRAPGRNLLV